MNATAEERETGAIDPIDRRIIVATQRGLPLSPRPYQAVAREHQRVGDGAQAEREQRDPAEPHRGPARHGRRHGVAGALWKELVTGAARSRGRA